MGCESAGQALRKLESSREQQDKIGGSMGLLCQQTATAYDTVSY